jgi:Uma2 family endonuclease
MDLAPDLVVEVLSPTDRARGVREKVADWLRAGTRLVWVIDPANRSVTVYRSREDFQQISERDTLDGGEVVPGFSCNIGDLYT